MDPPPHVVEWLDKKKQGKKGHVSNSPRRAGHVDPPFHVIERLDKKKKGETRPTRLDERVMRPTIPRRGMAGQEGKTNRMV